MTDGSSTLPGSTEEDYMRIRNYHIYGNQEFLKRLEEDYAFLGRSAKLEEDRLVVFALPRRKKKVAATNKKRGKRH